MILLFLYATHWPRWRGEALIKIRRVCDHERATRGERVQLDMRLCSCATHIQQASEGEPWRAIDTHGESRRMGLLVTVFRKRGLSSMERQHLQLRVLSYLFAVCVVYLLKLADP